MATLRKCLNPHCKHVVPTHKRAGNTSGVKGYCSRRCYYYFPPKMVEVVKSFPNYPRNRVGIRKIIQAMYQEGKSRLDTAYRIGITWHTLARWERKIFGRLLKKITV